MTHPGGDLRASQHDQSRPGRGPADRRSAQFAQARGWQIVDEYVDHGVSGSKDSRPELNRLMADATSGASLTWCSSGS